MSEKRFIRINDKDIFKPSEVAEILGVSTWTVIHKYINYGKGSLSAFKLGNGTGKRGKHRHWRIRREALLEFLNKSQDVKERE